MNVVILTGSHIHKGNSIILADYFQEGAEEAGHQIFRFDAAHKHVHSCIGCQKCGEDGPCIFKDDFTELREPLVNADMILFSTPMYYFGMSSQLKAVIDRFFAIDKPLHRKKYSVLFITCWNKIPDLSQGIIQTWRNMLNFMGWEDKGVIIGGDLDKAEEVLKTEYPQKAYELGKTFAEHMG